jgi:hypothetical protein
METDNPKTQNTVTAILEEGAKEAYSRPWHKLERGLRLNRIRLWVNENFAATLNPQGDSLFSHQELEHIFNYLSNALDKKLLNTSKIVEYDGIKQRIVSIKNFDVRRQTDGAIRCGFLKKKNETARVSSKSHTTPTTGTRRNKKATGQTVNVNAEVTPPT